MYAQAFVTKQHISPSETVLTWDEDPQEVLGGVRVHCPAIYVRLMSNEEPYKFERKKKTSCG